MRALVIPAMLVLVWLPAQDAGARGRPVHPAAHAAPPAAPVAAAQPAGPPAGEPVVPEYRFAAAGDARSSSAWEGVRPLLALAVVLGLLALGVKLARRWPGLVPRQGRGPLQMLGRLPLGAKEAVCLVQAGQDILVVGVSGGGVTLLHRLPADPRDHSGRSGALPPEPAQARFRDLAARIRDVQAIWGRPASSGEKR